MNEAFNISNLQNGLAKYEMLEHDVSLKQKIDDLEEYRRRFEELNPGKTHGRRK